MVEKRVSIPLGRFVYVREHVPLRGAYIYPLKYFGDERSLDPNDYLEVLRVVPVRGVDVAVTRGGGMFVRGPQKADTELEAVAEILNLLLCEFAFMSGLYSQPVSGHDVQAGKLIGLHAAIFGGGGDFAERTWGPAALLASDPGSAGMRPGENLYWPPFFYWNTHDPSVLEQLDGVPVATALAKLSKTLPALIVAAAYHAARHNLAETITTCWFVTEQLLFSLWQDYIAAIESGERRSRLKDYRTYTAAVQIETLQAVGHVDDELAAQLHAGRKVRNDMAHKTAMSLDAASQSLQTMYAALARLDFPVERLPGFSWYGSGFMNYDDAIEPDFPFGLADW
ncbi:hypothetical protein C8N24_0288 [Solirubrobacter pauli]|uniref:Apea-like HEPN domain-containing protein n=1 Tax=Solirubrobacter pauli TaxID=166793 RepID=A0A660L999_9ACTN|nr:hypothetical protein [Solirubrobacter pauli]RKQ90483.1 hypothetical protein C8N24_0288 [Solirubrobacter pauli]